MGMYTEFHFNVELKKDVPKEVVDALNIMLHSDKGRHDNLPDHSLFQTDRWWCMLRMDSYYFNADTHSTLRFDNISNAYILCIRCNVKNYNSEIEKFVDWIKPHLADFKGDFLGFSRYEEIETPTLIYMD